VQGAATSADADPARQPEVVDAFLAASREGDFEALLAVLDPDVVLRIDGGAVRAGLSREVRGARAVAEQTFTFSLLSPFVRPALVNGAAGVVVAPRGRPFAVMGFTVGRGKIAEIDVLADPERLRRLDLAVLDD
jgi:ketosteroid isomerase-like protein